MTTLHKPITRTKLEINFKPENKDSISISAEFESIDIDDPEDYILKTAEVLDKINKETRFKICNVSVPEQANFTLEQVLKYVKKNN